MSIKTHRQHDDNNTTGFWGNFISWPQRVHWLIPLSEDTGVSKLSAEHNKFYTFQFTSDIACRHNKQKQWCVPKLLAPQELYINVLHPTLQQQQQQHFSGQFLTTWEKNISNNGTTTPHKGVLSDSDPTCFGHTLNPAVECDFVSLTREVLASTRSFVKIHKSVSSWNYARNYTKWEGHDLYLDPPPSPQSLSSPV